MPKVFVLDFSELPLYPIKVGQLEGNTNNELAEWLKKRNETGRDGEDIAKQYLQTKYKHVRSADKDSYGYDIQADDQYFEIKTSKSKRQDFFITINELKIANKHKEKYCIFYIELDKAKSEALGYIIKNPFGSFDITLFELSQSIQKGNILFDAVVYKIQLGGFLDSIERIDLSDILRSIEKTRNVQRNEKRSRT